MWHEEVKGDENPWLSLKMRLPVCYKVIGAKWKSWVSGYSMLNHGHQKEKFLISVDCYLIRERVKGGY